MDITDIESKTFAELKADRGAIEEAAKQVPIDILGPRYVRARMDATQRDEKLGEQGRRITEQDETIAGLRDGIAAMKRQAELAENRVRQLTQALEAKTEETAQALESLRKTSQENALADIAALAAVSESLQQETERANRLKAKALAHRKAMVDAAGALNKALGAQLVEAADQGE